MNVDDIVRIRIEDARRKVEAARRRRAAMGAARAKGLPLRHAAKLRAQAARRPAPEEPDVTTTTDVPEVRVSHRAAGWTLPFLSPDVQACTSTYAPEREGMPPCTAVAVWKVAEVYADLRATIGFWCDDHMPAEHRHLAPHHTEGDRL